MNDFEYRDGRTFTGQIRERWNGRWELVVLVRDESGPGGRTAMLRDFPSYDSEKAAETATRHEAEKLGYLSEHIVIKRARTYHNDTS